MKIILDFKSFKMNERFNIDEYDPEIAEWEIELQNSIKKLEKIAKGVKLINIKAMSNIKGPFANVEILGDTYKVWSESNDRLFIEDFIIDNTDEDLKINGFIGTIEEIAETINNMEHNESNDNDRKETNIGGYTIYEHGLRRNEQKQMVPSIELEGEDEEGYMEYGTVNIFLNSSHPNATTETSEGHYFINGNLSDKAYNALESYVKENYPMLENAADKLKNT